MIWQDWMKIVILAEVGAQLNSLSPSPQCPRTPRGLSSGLNFLVAFLYPLWDLLGPSEAGAGPLVLPRWTARTCQRCLALVSVCWGAGTAFTSRGSVFPHPRLASLLRAPFSCKRRRYPADGQQGRPRAGLLCSALCQRAGLLAPSALTSAHPGPYPGRPCCMVMGCQGDIHLFSGPGPQLRGALGTDGGGA